MISIKKTNLIVMGCMSSLLGGIAQQKSPNIVFLLADDMRAATLEQFQKEDCKTPNLHTLGNEGVVFTNAHIMGGTSGAVSMPSRAMLMSGKYLFRLEGQGQNIPKEHITMGEALQKAGYTTFHIGKWHNGQKAFNRCFNNGKDIFFGGMSDHWNVPLHNYQPSGDYGNKRRIIEKPGLSKTITCGSGEYMHSGLHSVDIFAETAIDFINKVSPDDKPFFLYVAFLSPHDPRSTYDRYMNLYDTADISLPPNYATVHPFDNGEMKIRDEILAAQPRQKDEVKCHIRDYYAMISHLDDRIGDIIETLKKNNLYDNTIIVFAADNGLAVGQHGLMGKQNVYEHSVNVPLIIKEAGKNHPVKTTDKLCYLIDLYPTLCELAGAEIPSSVDGKSLVPIIENDETVRPYLYYSYKNLHRAVSDGEWKLIEYNVKGVRNTQLFNLKKDPWETINMANQHSSKKIVSRLRQQMKVERDATDDNSSFWKDFEF